MSKGVLRQLEEDAVELNIPTSSEPVAAADRVACVHCKRVVALRETDVVGLGYRCRACSDRAELGELTGAPDVSDHLVAADRARFSAAGRRIFVRALILSGAMGALGIFVLVVMPNPAAIKLILLALITGIAVGGHGYARWKRFG